MGISRSSARTKRTRARTKHTRARTKLTRGARRAKRVAGAQIVADLYVPRHNGPPKAAPHAQRARAAGR